MEKFNFAAGKIRWDGVILMLLGLFMLIFPGASVKIVCIILGIALIVMGIMLIISYVKERNIAPIKSNLYAGIGMIVLGILVFIFSDFFVSILLIAFGLILLYGCYVLFRQAYEMSDQKGKDFFLPLIMGIIILVLGILMVTNPAGSAAFVARMCGIALLVEGFSFLISKQER